jgi:hypothetical protein
MNKGVGVARLQIPVFTNPDAFLLLPHADLDMLSWKLTRVPTTPIKISGSV